MTYQKIRAESFEECMNQVRMKYGPEVIVIDRREITEGGMLGRFFKKKICEVTVRVPKTEEKARQNPSVRKRIEVLSSLLEKREREDRTAHPEDPFTARTRNSASDRSPGAGFGESLRESIREEDRDNQVLRNLYGLNSPDRNGVKEDKSFSEGLETNPRSFQGRSPASGGEGSPPRRDFQRELSEISRKLGLSESELRVGDSREPARREKPAPAVSADETSGPESSAPTGEPPAHPAEKGFPVEKIATATPAGNQSSTRNLDRVRDRLIEQDVSQKFTEDFLRELTHQLSPAQLEDPEQVLRQSRQSLSGHIAAQPQIRRGPENQKVIMLVGPTGVGKTTTLAKMAANLTYQEEKTVAFVTVDYYRIAAMEQLKKYAEIIAVPFHTCRSPLNFAKVLEDEDSEIILVDTSGCSPTNTEMLTELKSFVQSCPLPLEVHLVLSATTRPKTTEVVLDAYKKIGFHKIILTKLDECDFIGSFVEVADKYNRPFSFLTNGQDVPNDILNAGAREMAEIVFPGDS